MAAAVAASVFGGGTDVKAEIPDDKRATEYLANERTFLAWVRTSIAIMSLGFVVARFGLWLRELATHLAPQAQMRGSGSSAPIGLGMIALGGAIILVAAWRFHKVNRQIDEGAVEADGRLVLLMTVAMAALALLMMGYIGLTTTARP
jgi:putative membrane protein